MAEEDQPTSSSPVSDRCQWRRILRAMVEMVRSQQSQIETLAGDRKFLEDYVHLQHDRWVSKVRFLESQLAQAKAEEVERMRVQSTSVDLLVGMKKNEGLCYKKQLELSQSDLDDFREYVEALISEVSELKIKIDESRRNEANQGRKEDAELKSVENVNGQEQCNSTLEGDIRRLKHAYRKLSAKKEAEVSALLAEKHFVWNQFKRMESDYTAILKTKRIEVDQANEAVEKLQLSIEKLQSLVNEKDESIIKLESDRSRLELDIRQQKKEAGHDKQKIGDLEHKIEELHSSHQEKDEVIDKLRSDLVKIEMKLKRCTTENSILAKDSRSQRKSRNASATPVPSQPRKASGKRGQESRSNRVNQKSRLAYGDSSGSQASGGVSLRRCSSRETRSSSAPETPKLFSSTFKVPKVKDTFTAVS